MQTSSATNVATVRNTPEHQIDYLKKDGMEYVRFSSFVDCHFQNETIVPLEEIRNLGREIRAKNIVFLDIDGVMTSVENGTSYLCGKTENYHLDKVCQSWMERLWTDVPDLKVVVSSAWCNRGEVTDPTPDWPWKGISMPTPLPSLYQWLVENNKYFGKLDNRNKKNGGKSVSKFQKICDWMALNFEKVDHTAKVLVLDDDDTDYNELSKIDKRDSNWHFQKVDYKRGFDYGAYVEALDFFNKN